MVRKGALLWVYAARGLWRGRAAGLGLGLLLPLLMVGVAPAQSFVDVATISATMGVNDGRICLGEGSRRELGCPTYAPSVSSGGLLNATSLLTGGLTVTGATSVSTLSATTIQALNFIGNGSGLTGVVASATDRIVSGTTSLVVNTNTGFVSLTQSTGNTGWFDPTRGLVTLGVSATGGISGTTGYFAGNVGIGTTAAQAQLDLTSNAAAERGLFIWNQNAGGYPSLRLGASDRGTVGDMLLFNTTAAVGLRAPATRPIIFEPSGTEVMRLSANGNVGIGTTNPTAPLTVSGSANISGTVRATAFVGDGSGLTNLPSSSISVDRITSGTVSAIANTANARIDISGSINLPAQNVAGTTANMIRQNGSPFISTFRPVGNDGSNLFIGVNSGNTTMSSSTPGQASYNLGVGQDTLRNITSGFFNTATGFQALLNNTTGRQNTAHGYQALQATTTGIRNTASGVSTMLNNTTGSQNTGLGGQVLFSNTTGNDNTGLGMNALFNNTTGNTNTALGHFTAIGITTGSSNTILGANVWGLPADLSSTIILADGDGNRRIYVHNNGFTGINLASGTLPTAMLTVSGSANISGTVRATAFVGDGSGLTNLSVSGDRITSGTTSVLAVSNTGFISFTQNNAVTAWFDPTRGLVTVGVSATGTVSATRLFVHSISTTGGLTLVSGTGGAGGGFGDRISTTGVTSGANLAMVVASSGTISFTLGGTAAAAYLHPSLGLVAPGVSTTGIISATELFTAGLLRAGGISATGTISATRLFVQSISGTGGLTLVSGTGGAGGGFGDRISTTGVASGANLAMVVASSGTVSFTLGGTAGAAYLHPTLGLVAPGVSTTGTISATEFFTAGLLRAGGISATGTISATRLFVQSISGTGGLTLVSGTGSGGSGGFGDRISTTGVASGANLAMVVASSGTISFTLGGTASAAYLHPSLGLVAPGVSTTGIISATELFTGGLLTALRVTATNVSASVGDFTTLRVGGVAVGGGASDRITSGTNTVTVNTNTNTVSFTLGGTTTAFSVSNSNMFMGQALPTGVNVSNTAFGVNALQAITSSGAANSAFGASALRSTLGGTHNTAIGSNALLANTTGTHNTAVGVTSLLTLTTGSFNTVLGITTGRGIVSGSNNTILGANVQGLRSDLSNTVIIADGDGNRRIYVHNNGFTGINLASGTLPTAMLEVSGTVSATGLTVNGVAITGGGGTSDRITSGTVSAIANTANSWVDISGSLNLPTQTAAGVTTNMIRQNGLPFIHTFRPTGNDGANLFIGVGSGNITMSSSTPTWASHNTAVGQNTLAANTSGYANTVIGRNALANNTTGGQNTASGAQTLLNNTTGSNNTAFGHNTGRGIVTGSSNTILGANVIGLPADLSNTVIIADGDGNQRLRVNPLGFVGVGVTTPTTQLEVAGTVSATGLTVNGVAITGGGGATNRISTTNVASGGNLAAVEANIGTVSFTLGGTAGAAYLHPSLGLVAPGVSTTGMISGTGLFTGGLVTANRVTTTNISASVGDFTTLRVGGVAITSASGGGGSTTINNFFTTATPNLIPVMTGNTTPEGTATASSVYGSGYEAWRGFDNADSAWGSSGTTGWLEYEFTVSQTLASYAVTAASENEAVSFAARSPRDWTFEFWNGSSWVTADTRTNQSSWSAGERRSYTLASSNTSRRWRINISANNGGSVLTVLRRLEMLGDPNAFRIPSDRISTTNVASGANLAMVVTDIGTVSFTLGGTAGAAYLHPSLGLVAPGVSTTGMISGTGLFTGGLVTANRVTTTNISASVGDFTTLRVGGVAVGSGTSDRITSGTVSAIANTANARIDISGSLNLPAQNVAGNTASMIRQNGSPFISTFRSVGNDGHNLFIGVNSGNTVMISTTSTFGASYNTGVGQNTLANNSTGFYNTAIGVSALFTNTTGSNNTASGVNALVFNTTGRNNTATGAFTLQTNTTGSNNTASGLQALHTNNTGYQNTASGVNALYFNTSGYDNTATGFQALYRNTIGYANNAHGSFALLENTTGVNNIAFGGSALQNNTTGTDNTAVGTATLFATTTGSSNTVVGRTAFYELTTGNNNTGLGFDTGRGITTGSGNTILGASVSGLPSDLSNTIILADGTGTQRLRINSNGFAGFGTATPNARVEVVGTISATNGFFSNDINYVGTLTDISDRREKTAIKPLGEGMLQKVLALRPVSFAMKVNPGKPEFGFIAQEVQALFPQLVETQGGPNGRLALNTIGMLAPVVQALQELAARVAAMADIVTQQRQEIQQLQTQQAAQAKAMQLQAAELAKLRGLIEAQAKAQAAQVKP